VLPTVSTSSGPWRRHWSASAAAAPPYPLGIVVAVLTVGGLVALSRSSAATVATTPEDEVVAPPA
jgi:hypothetical protein